MKKEIETENKLLHLLKKAKDGIYISNTKGTILYQNEAASAIADLSGKGNTEKEIFGLPEAATACSGMQHNAFYQKKLPDGRFVSTYSLCLNSTSEEENQHIFLSFLREIDADDDDDINTLQVYQGSAMAHVLNHAVKLAKINSPVLITGESGTGKIMLGKYIHRNSTQSGKPFVCFNCAAMPEELLEEEFFGRAGFTGEQEKPGIIATAANGTLFLDEIDALPIFIQTRLLYTLHEKSYHPVGGRKSLPVECRIIAATDRDLSTLVAEGTFREDFYYQIAVFEVKIPPIRERAMDIMPLLHYLAERYNKRYWLRRQITKAALDVMAKYSWPGNLREMDNTMERLIVMAPEDIIDVYHLPDHIRFRVMEESNNCKERSSLDEAIEEVEGAIIRRTYEEYGSSYEVGRILKISQSKASRLIRKYCAKK